MDPNIEAGPGIQPSHRSDAPLASSNAPNLGQMSSSSQQGSLGTTANQPGMTTHAGGKPATSHLAGTFSGVQQPLKQTGPAVGAMSSQQPPFSSTAKSTDQRPGGMVGGITGTQRQGAETGIGHPTHGTGSPQQEQLQGARESNVQDVPMHPIVDLVHDRLHSWKVIVKNLIRHFEIVAENSHREAEVFGKACRYVDPIGIGILKHSTGTTSSSTPAATPGTTSGIIASPASKDVIGGTVMSGRQTGSTTGGLTGGTTTPQPASSHHPQDTTQSQTLSQQPFVPLQHVSALEMRSKPMFPIESDIQKALLFETQLNTIAMQENVHFTQSIQNSVVDVLEQMLDDIRTFDYHLRQDLGQDPHKGLERDHSSLAQSQAYLHKALDSRMQVLRGLAIHAKKRKEEGIEDNSLLESIDRIRSPDTDPWLLYHELHLNRTSHNQMLQTLSDSNKRRLDHYQSFENNLCQSLRNILLAAESARYAMLEKILQQSRLATQQAQNIEGVKEFSLLKELHPRFFTAVPVSLDDLGGMSTASSPLSAVAGAGGPAALQQQRSGGEASQEAVESALCQITRHGYLELKRSGVLLRGWKEMYAIVTGTGYLHFYSANTDLSLLVGSHPLNKLQPTATAEEMTYDTPLQQQEGSATGERRDTLATSLSRRLSMRSSSSSSISNIPDPEFSICLSDCILHPHPLVSCPPEELHLEEAKKSGIFSRSGTVHMIRAKSRIEAENWWKSMAPYARLALQVESKPLPEPIAPSERPVMGESGPGATGTGLGTTGTGLGAAGTGLGAAGVGHGATGTGLGTTGAGLGATGVGHGTTGIGHGTTGIGHGATGTTHGTSPTGKHMQTGGLPQSRVVREE